MVRQRGRTAAIAMQGPVSTENLSALRFDAQALVKGGVRDLSVDIDAAPALTDPLTATLIRILRDVRARGGSLTVVAGREPLLRGLHRHALDRIVSVVRPQPLTSAI